MESNVLKEISRLNRQANQNRNCTVKVEPDHEMFAITPDTGMFFSVLLKAIETRRILKVDTSVRFSTLWLADA
jgi:caffeoyl-CoA O-methyltransferase